MSFDDRDKRFRDDKSNEDDFYELDDRNKKRDDSMSDFLKDEDFEFEGFEEKEEEDIESEGLRSKRIKQRKKRRRTIFRITAVLFVMVIIAVAIVFWLVPWVKGKFTAGTEAPEEDERITIPESLALGRDINLVIACAGDNLLEPDVSSIIFSSYYSSDNKLISLCIPTRTLMDIPGFGAEIVARAVNVGGMDLLDLCLENNLGMDIEMDYHILMDVFNVVNRLGGLEIQLEEEISIKNYSDGSTFSLEEGTNLIDGAEALNFLKYFSGIEKDVQVENIKKQKMIIDAIIKKIVGENEEEFSANLNQVKDFMDTNLSMEDRLKVFSALAGVETASNYVYALSVSSTELEGEDIVYVPQDISKLADIFSKEGIPPEEETEGFTEMVKITVLNGAYDSPEASGLAGSTSEVFKNSKFEDGSSKYEVIEVGNADNMYESTQILVYSPDTNKLAAAEDIKQTLGIGEVKSRENEIIDSDIIIILGKDYLALSTDSGEEEVEEGLIKIIVLNGQGTAGLAGTASGILEDYFNSEEETVVMLEPGDADNYDYDQTIITIFTSRAGVNELAQKIQERLGAGVIEYSENNVNNVDISVILGSDYVNQ